MANFVIKSALSLAALASLLALVPAAPAEAQNVKSWVANTGSDANDCTLAHPCATLAHAHDRTNPGGEVGVLTPGDYRVVTPLAIDRSIHITNDGAGEASILQPGSIGVDIQSNLGRGDIVSLRGLVIDGQGTGQMGIQSTGRATLHMQNCVIRNFVFNGIWFVVSGVLFVSDTIIFNNGSGDGNGGIVLVADVSSDTRVVLDRVHLENNTVGLRLDGRNRPGGEIHVVVRDSVISGNSVNGIFALTSPGGAAFAIIERSSIVGNGQNGMLADGPRATILLKLSTIALNGTGVTTANGGQLISYGNNTNTNNFGPEGTATGFFGQM